MPIVDPKTAKAFRDGEAALQSIAGVIDRMLPEGLCFSLVIYTVGDGGYASYVSNGHRADMIKAMRECAEIIEAKAESPPGSDLERN